MNILGVMSGNSCDGLDLCDVDIEIDSSYNLSYKIKNYSTIPFLEDEKKFIHSIRENEKYKIKENETKLTTIFINKIRMFSSLEHLDYISCHGQTVSHIDKVSSLQLFDAKLCYDSLGIPVIYNFRDNDIMNGGNGAPLMPFLDWLLFSDSSKDIVTLNVGGISNISHIPKSKLKDEVRGFDTGPGMCLVDMACRKLFNSSYDHDSKFSNQGLVDKKLLNELLDLPLVKKNPPKSMDINDFGEDIISQISISNSKLNNYDILRTLVEFTVESIHYNIYNFIKLDRRKFDLVISGGGTDHPLVRQGFIRRGYEVKSVSKFGIDSSAKEAFLMALLGASRAINLKSNIPTVTGACKYVTLGEIYAG